MTTPAPNDLPKAAIHKSILRSATKQEPTTIVRLVECVEQDYQFKLGYLVIESLVRSAPISIELDTLDPSRDQPRARALADNLEAVWLQALPSAIRAFAYGRAAFEKTYRYDQANGLYLVADLDYLPPEYTELVLDDGGCFAGVKLSVGKESTLLDPPRAWWFALDPTATEPHGRSRYLGAPFDIWKERRQLEEQERIWYSKFAIGHGVARAPERVEPLPPYQTSGSKQLDDGSGTNDPMEVLRHELASIESGGILILSSRTYPDGTPLYDYKESEGQRDSSPLEQRRQMLDVAALRSLGIPERAITQDDRSGSRAMAQVHLEVLYRTCEGILDQLIASYEQYVIRKAIEINWPENRRPGYRMRYRPIGDATTTIINDANTNPTRKLSSEDRLPDLSRSKGMDVGRQQGGAKIAPTNPALYPAATRVNGHYPRVFPR